MFNYTIYIHWEETPNILLSIIDAVDCRGRVACYLQSRDPAMGQIYGSGPARRSFGADNVALNVFNSLSTEVNVCVLSNGVLL